MRPIVWNNNTLCMIDQRILPVEEKWLEFGDADSVAEAISTMVVRGAPAIGVAAAYGLALEAAKFPGSNEQLQHLLAEKAAKLESTRPTAINLKWALDRMLAKAAGLSSAKVDELRHQLVEEALEIHQQDIRLCQAIGRNGAELISPGSRVLTHCNAGALATGDYGTALGVIRAARDKIENVWVDETRPFLQGARLTAWELQQENIPCQLICDNMAGHFMQRKMVDLVIVGADRITSEGAVANKIGTYSLAVLCRFHEIPFYVAAPYSTVDLTLASGFDIPIEERSSREVTHIGEVQVAPTGINVANPAFDMTPPDLVTAIITERGVIRAPFRQGLADLVAAAGTR